MDVARPLFRDRERLTDCLGGIPVSPGVYLFRDCTDGIIYVGKSVALRDRVRSYFIGRATNRKLRRLRQEVVRVEWREAGSELEALLLESRLIKRYQPRFNVLLRGFLPRPYLRVDLTDPFPRLDVTREPSRDGATYFGPFGSRKSLDAAVRTVADALRLRDCPVSGHRIREVRPCYRGELGTCAAPCRGNTEAHSEAYSEAVDRACSLFRGDDTSLAELEQRMVQSAERQQFELAARLRDAMLHVRALAGRQQALASAVRSLTLVAACPALTQPDLCLFLFRSGHLVYEAAHPLEDFRTVTQRRRLARKLTGLARTTREPDRVDAALLDEIQIVTHWMKQKTRSGDYFYLRDDSPGGALAAPQPELVETLARWLGEQSRKQAPRR
jgi:excinuclease UvrABC nuclease subunit